MHRSMHDSPKSGAGSPEHSPKVHSPVKPLEKTKVAYVALLLRPLKEHEAALKEALDPDFSFLPGSMKVARPPGGGGKGFKSLQSQGSMASLDPDFEHVADISEQMFRELIQDKPAFSEDEDDSDDESDDSMKGFTVPSCTSLPIGEGSTAPGTETGVQGMLQKKIGAAKKDRGMSMFQSSDSEDEEDSDSGGAKGGLGSLAKRGLGAGGTPVKKPGKKVPFGEDPFHPVADDEEFVPPLRMLNTLLDPDLEPEQSGFVVIYEQVERELRGRAGQRTGGSEDQGERADGRTTDSAGAWKSAIHASISSVGSSTSRRLSPASLINSRVSRILVESDSLLKELDHLFGPGSLKNLLQYGEFEDLSSGQTMRLMDIKSALEADRRRRAALEGMVSGADGEESGVDAAKMGGMAKTLGLTPAAQAVLAKLDQYNVPEMLVELGILIEICWKWVDTTLKLPSFEICWKWVDTWSRDDITSSGGGFFDDMVAHVASFDDMGTALLVRSATASASSR